MRLSSLSSLSLVPLFFLPTARIAAQLPLPSPPWLPPSPDFRAGPPPFPTSPNIHWLTLLGNGLFFYEAQRSGRLPSTNRVSWRGDTCPNDGQDVDLDLSGGYYDRGGDFIKSTLPLSFSIMQVCWGAIDHGGGYDLSNQTAYLDDMLRWGLEWLIEAHPSPYTLFVQIGDFGRYCWEADNNITSVELMYGGADEQIPWSGRSYQINSTNPGTDVAALTAAAFASCSSLYSGRSFKSYSSPASLKNDSFASTLLQHAQELYSFAVNAQGGQMTYQIPARDVWDNQPSSGYGDDLTMAALWLGFAQNDSTLISQAKEYFDKFRLNERLPDSVFSSDSPLPGVPILGTQIYRSYPQLGGENWQSLAEMYLDRLVSGKGAGKLTKGGLLYYDRVSPNGSVAPAINAAMLLKRYAVIATSDKAHMYQEFAGNQISYILGANPMSVPYVVGIHPNSPHNPYSHLANGGNPSKIYGLTVTRVLYGAVVAGPDKQDRYYDLSDDWPQTGVSADRNAPLLTLAAMHLISGEYDPAYTSLEIGVNYINRPRGYPCDAAYSCYPAHTTAGKVAVAVAVTLVSFVTVFLIVRFLRREGLSYPAHEKSA